MVLQKKTCRKRRNQGNEIIWQGHTSMINQDFSFKEFNYLVTRGDYFKYFKTAENTREANKARKENLLKGITNNTDFSKHIFTTIRKKQHGKDAIYCLERIRDDNFQAVLADDFILRKLNKILKFVYDVQQANRFNIVRTIQNLLETNSRFYVYKTDIHKFYESINRNAILDNLKGSALLSYTTRTLLERLFSMPLFPEKGLPRGVNISATLSEYFMKKFDNQVRSMDGVFFYARYVDDIIVFSTKSLDIYSQALLPQGLSFNKQKTIILYFDGSDESKSFCFLGYEFTKQKQRVKIAIAPRKINKIKRKIVQSLVDFNKRRDFELLKDRLLFLTANYPIKTSRQKLSKYAKNGVLHGGIAYNYPIINEMSCLQKLDMFAFQVFHSSNFARLNQNLTAAQQSIISKYSFVIGFNRHITRRFTQDRLQQIALCWGA